VTLLLAWPTSRAIFLDRDVALGHEADEGNRPLDRVYPVLFADAIVVKVMDGQVANRPV